MPHPWPVFTPEDNHTTLTRLGTGPATTLAYHAALTAQIATLESVAASSAASAAGTYGPAWQGAGAAASSAAQTGLNAAAAALSGWLAEKLPLIATVVSGWQSAAAAMVPAEACVQNRTEEAVDQQINPWVWGALTPRIADLDLEYFGHMWPRNAAAGAAYGATAHASAVAVLAAPPPPAITGGSVAAPTAAAATVAEDGGASAAGTTLRSGARTTEALISQTTSSAVSRMAGAPQALRAAPLPMPVRPPAVLGPAGRPGTASSPIGAMGMFAPASTSALAAPAGAGEPGQPVGPPRGASGPPTAGGYPGAGLTSYLRPANGFAAAPAGGRPVSAAPGMLNAAALRGDPLTTTHPVAGPLAPVPSAPSQAPARPAAADPNSDSTNVAKLRRQVDDFRRRWTDFEHRVAAHNRKSTGYDSNDPLQRQAFGEYQREKEALLAEELRLAREGGELQEKVADSGLTVVDGEVRWPWA